MRLRASRAGEEVRPIRPLPGLCPLLALPLLLACSDSRMTPDGSQAEQLEREVGSLADGRWSGWEVRVSGGRHVAFTIDVANEANEVAQDAYCRALGEVAFDVIGPGVTWEAELRKLGGQVVSRRCSGPKPGGGS